MENIYNLSGRYLEISDRYDAAMAELDSVMEENGGELTEFTESQMLKLEEIEQMRQEILSEIVSNSDKYAEIALNKAAQLDVIEAQIKAIKAEQKKVIEKYEAQARKLQRSIDWWTNNFIGAMNIAGVEKLGGAKTNLMHSIAFRYSKAVEVDQNIIEEKYGDLVRPAELPSWIKVDLSVDKNAIKKMDAVPEGCAVVEKQSLVIR